MNAEALIGTVLGTCTLQKLVGQGGMGAVFLAQQSRPRRQVAVKVLLPMAPLSPNQLSAFLERFRRETDAAASLEHPNIVPVHEYGERNGVAYLVMPYISGGTLRDEMEREGPLALPVIVNYLDQIAAALDFAHEHGVIHRDIKPANILMTTEHRLLLTDFGLVKIVAEGRIPQVRLTGAGAPVGTPDYMAPEQVIGEDVDARADLYSLGVILFQMVTGTTPFQGETPMQIAAQHLQVPPPSPQMLRPDLPIVAEQVMLRALAKRPADRYKLAQDLATAFRQALVGMGVPQIESVGRLNGSTSGRLPTPKGQTNQMPAAVSDRQDLFRPSLKMPAAGIKLPANTGMLPVAGTMTPKSNLAAPTNDGFSTATGALPAAGNRGSGGLLSRTGMFPAITSGSLPAAGVGMPTATGTLPTASTGAIPTSTGAMNAARGGGLLSRTGKFPQAGAYSAPDVAAGGAITTRNTAAQPFSPGFESFAPSYGTGALGDAQGAKTTMKLSSPMKVVKLPVAGQPGQFVTGLLPALDGGKPNVPAKGKKPMRSWMKVVAALVALLLIAGVVGGVFAYVRNQPTMTNQGKKTAGPTMATTPNPKATAQAQATGAAQANTILADPLDHNIHGWYESAADGYQFMNGAYHITNKNKDKSSATVLQSFSPTGPLVYTLTMQAIKGDEASDVNSFGMIFRYNQQGMGAKTVSKFYSFEVLNKKGGEYKFWKYDSAKGDGAKAWGDPIWHQPFGNEFHQGHGPQAVNTFKIIMDGSKFTFIVNGKTIKTQEDKAYPMGSVGMIVNLNGTEVAFKNMFLTKK